MWQAQKGKMRIFLVIVLFCNFILAFLFPNFKKAIFMQKKIHKTLHLQLLFSPVFTGSLQKKKKVVREDRAGLVF